jgi:hypothetical protein
MSIVYIVRYINNSEEKIKMIIKEEQVISLELAQIFINLS